MAGITEFEYHVGHEGSGEVVTVPKGFLTDGASIPRIFWVFVGPPWGKYGYAAIVHDYLYHIKIYTRKRSDQIFYEAMGVLGVSTWKRRVMFTAVRLVGWIPWNNRKPFVTGKPYEPKKYIKTTIAFALVLLLTSCATVDFTYEDKENLVEEKTTYDEDKKVKEVTKTYETKTRTKKIKQTGLGKFSGDGQKANSELAPDWLPTVPIYKD